MVPVARAARRKNSRADWATGRARAAASAGSAGVVRQRNVSRAGIFGREERHRSSDDTRAGDTGGNWQNAALSYADDSIDGRRLVRGLARYALDRKSVV